MGVDGFGTLREQFLVHIGIERGLAKATVSAYESDLNKYVAWLQTHGITKPDDIAKQDVEDYIATLDADGESARSKAADGSDPRIHRLPWPSMRYRRMWPLRSKPPKGPVCCRTC